MLAWQGPSAVIVGDQQGSQQLLLHGISCYCQPHDSKQLIITGLYSELMMMIRLTRLTLSQWPASQAPLCPPEPRTLSAAGTTWCHFTLHIVWTGDAILEKMKHTQTRLRFLHTRPLSHSPQDGGASLQLWAPAWPTFVPC